MIRNIIFGGFFLFMVIKPEAFNQARDDKTREVVSKVMRVCGIIGLVCICIIMILQFTGVV